MNYRHPAPSNPAKSLICPTRLNPASTQRPGPKKQSAAERPRVAPRLAHSSTSTDQRTPYHA